MNVSISVITASYNRKHFIDNCIKSVQNCIILDVPLTIEHIIVDDASSDGTADHIEQSYPHVKLIRLPQNSGPSAARNIGCQSAQGEYIFILDSDDVLLQTSLLRLYTSVVTQDTYIWAYGDFLKVNSDLSYQIGEDYYGFQFTSIDSMLSSIFSGQHFMQHSALFPKSLFQNVGGYDPDIRMAEDLDLFIRFIKSGKLPLYVPVTTHLHRTHDNNLSKEVTSIKHMQDLVLLAEKHQYPLT
jgi:glycosyltransferase involved in cell wall biosynthesis